MTHLIPTIEAEVIPMDNHQNNAVENVYIAKSHWVSYVKPISYIIFALIGIAVFFSLSSWFRYLIGSVSFITLFNATNSFIQYKTFKIVVKGKQISISAGLVSRHQLDIPIHRREGIFVNQSILGRIFNYGEITIATGGVSATHTIAKPNELRNELYNQLITKK